MKKCFLFLFILGNCYLYSQETVKNGYAKIYYPNGNISSEGLMVNGKPDGFWKTYYVNGLLKSEGRRVNHLLDSIWVFYTETGDTIEKITYLLGKKNGYYLKYQNTKSLNNTSVNTLLSKELYINDIKQSLSYYYNEKGNIRLIINYKNNKKDGTAKEFNDEGTLISLYNYLNDYLTEKINLNRIESGNKQGLWREYYPNGTVKSEKNYDSGQVMGYVREFDEKGKLILSQLYVDGKLQDKIEEDTIDIEERITYYSDKKVKTRFYYKSGIPVGIHREYNERGEVINTWIYNNVGVLTGKGIVMDDGSREGNFTYFYDDGTIKSTGEYIQNRQNGKWLFYFKNNKFEQIGNFVNGYLNGEWKWFYSDSAILRVENFVNNSKDGLYLEFSATSDTIVKGFYKNNLKNGTWYIKSGDNYSIGKYVNDLKEGLWKTYYASGVLMYEGNYNQGFPEGKHLFYYENRLLKEEQFYVSGMREKVWKKYNEDGTLFVSITYQNDTEARINGYKLEIVK